MFFSWIPKPGSFHMTPLDQEQLCEFISNPWIFLDQVIGFNKHNYKLLFDGVFFAPASVGEATSLPCGTTLQNWVRSGEFVQITNISPFNQPLKKRSVAGG